MKSGYYRVDIDNNKLYNGYFSVRYRTSCKGKNISISKTSIQELEQAVIKEGLPWKIIDIDMAHKTKIFADKINNLKNHDISKKITQITASYQVELDNLQKLYSARKLQLTREYMQEKQIYEAQLKEAKNDIFLAFIADMNNIKDNKTKQ